MIFLRISCPNFGFCLRKVIFKNTQFDIKEAQINFNDTQFGVILQAEVVMREITLESSL